MKNRLTLLFGIFFLLIVIGIGYSSFHMQKKVSVIKTNPLDTVPKGTILSSSDIKKAFSLFHDQYLTGGQQHQSPRIVRWVNPNTFVFLEFDNPKQSFAKRLQFIGIGVKGVYCSETQPDSSFPHFLKYDAPSYDQVSQLKPGDQGYWLSFVAVDSFKYDGRQDTPGIDYQYDKLTPPTCGTTIPPVSFTPTDAKDLSHNDIMSLTSYFNDNPKIFFGGQKAPRVSKWVNSNVFMFLQFDNQADVTKATAVRYLGLGVRGEFCTQTRPSTDFPHLHMPVAKLYAFGHASHPKDLGYWLMGVAVVPFNNNGRDVSVEIDRKYNMEEIPSCKTGAGNKVVQMHMTPMPSGTQEVTQTPDQNQVIKVSATEFSFTPNEIHLKAGQTATIQFTNTGTMEHTFTIPTMHVDTGGLLPGHSKEITFTAPTIPGTYSALCAMGGHLQLGMKASIIVE